MFDIDALATNLQNPAISNKEATKQLILETNNLKEACILSKSFLSSQMYGALLEKWLKKRFQLNGAIDNASGDASSVNGTYEIKCSLPWIQPNGGSKVNLVQIRPGQDITAYIHLVYYIKTCEAILMYIPSHDLYDLLPEFGSYAHGTLKEHGPITPSSIMTNNYEYALRPLIGRPDLKAGRLWEKLQPYIRTEDEIRSILHKT